MALALALPAIAEMDLAVDEDGRRVGGTASVRAFGVSQQAGLDVGVLRLGLQRQAIEPRRKGTYRKPWPVRASTAGITVWHVAPLRLPKLRARRGHTPVRHTDEDRGVRRRGWHRARR